MKDLPLPSSGPHYHCRLIYTSSMGHPHGSYHRYMRSLVLAALGGQQELLAMMPVRDLADSLIENSLQSIGSQ
jgi:hypothetical protein